MTAPLFWAPAADLAGTGPGDTVLLAGDEGRHAVTVRRLAPGEPVLLGDGAGRVASGEVVRADRDGLAVRLDAVRDHPARTPALVLVQALAKGGRDELAVEAGCELGVDAVVPWQAERSIVRWDRGKAEKGRAKWANVLRAAAKQSRRATVPVLGPLLTGPGLAEDVRRRAAAGGTTLLLHEEAARPLAGWRPGPDVAEIALVVGPEGGIGDAERARLEAAGALSVRLGPEVLRASTAGPAALAVLSARLGRWT